MGVVYKTRNPVIDPLIALRAMTPGGRWDEAQRQYEVGAAGPHEDRADTPLSSTRGGINT